MFHRPIAASSLNPEDDTSSGEKRTGSLVTPAAFLAGSGLPRPHSRARRSPPGWSGCAWTRLRGGRSRSRREAGGRGCAWQPGRREAGGAPPTACRTPPACRPAAQAREAGQPARAQQPAETKPVERTKQPLLVHISGFAMRPLCNLMG